MVKRKSPPTDDAYSVTVAGLGSDQNHWSTSTVGKIAAYSARKFSGAGEE